MSYAAERTAIMTRWHTQWIAKHPTIRYAHGNARLDPKADEPWLRISILSGTSQQISFGAEDKGQHRHAGVISIEVFVPLGIGEALARTLLDDATEVFRSADFSGILCRAPSVAPPFTTSNYYKISTTIPFQRDEVFS